ncbi:hypothetical protein O7Q_00431 [Bartonella quintana JK 39]|nr:hypothetical protein O7Q_00431 [Bartonella quintana JK 39]
MPSREIIANSFEYMVNARCAEALVCISNYDKITPGMLMTSLRLNIPTIFVSGGPMETGKIKWKNQDLRSLRLLKITQKKKLLRWNMPTCPICDSCSGMLTANSMKFLTEALRLFLHENGSVLARYADRQMFFEEARR